MLCNERGHCDEKPTGLSRKQPLLSETGESPPQQRRPSSQKRAKKKKRIKKVWWTVCVKKKQALPSNNEDASPSSWSGLNFRKPFTLSWRGGTGLGAQTWGGLKPASQHSNASFSWNNNILHFEVGMSPIQCISGC